MKSTIRKVLVHIANGTFLRALLKKFLIGFSRIVPLPFGFLVEIGCLERPSHAYCMWNAAKLARRLGYDEISVAEFGVAGGVTLVIIDRYATEIAKATGVRVRVYGFDTGGGLPSLEGAKDLPYWFYPSQYPMDLAALRGRLRNAELIIGNVRDSVINFFAEQTRPPLAAMFIDLDFYSSTRDALQIFNADPRHFLPRLFLYLDDVGGGDVEMYGPFNGELAAVEEFNRQHDQIKIHLNQNLLPRSYLPWRYTIYYAHLFGHEKYSTYVGREEQSVIEASLRLQ